jgi:putative oxidoreductase
MKLWTYANTILDRIASYLADPFLLGIRLYWGWQFFLTGKGKLTHIDVPTAFFTKLGIPFPQANAYLAGCTECIGGLLLLLGLFSRVTCVPLICVLLVAYGTAHLDVVKTIWSDSDSFVTAPPFLFLLATLTVFIFGPGKFSVDELLRRKKR